MIVIVKEHLDSRELVVTLSEDRFILGGCCVLGESLGPSSPISLGGTRYHSSRTTLSVGSS
jgi:hypothetical protein